MWLQVTAAAEAEFGEERRDGFICGRSVHREPVPCNNSKKDLTGLANLTFF